MTSCITGDRHRIVTKHNPKRPTLRMLLYLIEYVLIESRDLSLPDLERLLGAAALAIKDELGYDARSSL
jgi:hypothetical protein